MGIKCHCYPANNCPPRSEGICYIKGDGYCYSHVELVTSQSAKEIVKEYTYGCFPGDVEGMLQCKGSLVNHAVPKNTTCCTTDLCNDAVRPSLSPQAIDNYYKELHSAINWQLLLAVGSASLLILFAIIALTIFFYRRIKLKKKDKLEKKKFTESQDSINKMMNDSFGASPCKPLLAIPQFVDPLKFTGYPKSISTHQQPYSLNYNQTASSSLHSDSSGSAPNFKYSYLNSSSGGGGGANGSNITINHYRNLSSTASHTSSSMNSEVTQQTTLSSQKPTSVSSLPPLSENSVTSGSGSGIPHLVQQTLAREIHLKECVGKGRYGNVYRGVRRGENLAVKIFFSRDDASWKREIEIYSTVIMRQENILGFFGADVTSQNGCTELWLVTEYHEMGSLYDYLGRRPVKSIYQLVSLMRAIIGGVSHLHTEVIGTIGKPAIAHRDLKSKNILMKGDFSCCIADFGLAVTKTQTNQIDIAQNHRVGTKRYMAPEVLNETMKSDIFESYRAADIYSLALVFWELYNRLTIDGKANDYNVPFQFDVPSDPSFEDMRQVVCIQEMRPLFDKRLPEDAFDSEILNSIHSLIIECWSQNPSSRQTSLYIKKKILNLTHKLEALPRA